MVVFTATTADDELCKKLEPNVSVTSRRFAAMQKLADTGIFCGVLMIPNHRSKKNISNALASGIIARHRKLKNCIMYMKPNAQGLVC